MVIFSHAWCDVLHNYYSYLYVVLQTGFYSAAYLLDTCFLETDKGKLFVRIGRKAMGHTMVIARLPKLYHHFNLPHEGRCNRNNVVIVLYLAFSSS